MGDLKKGKKVAVEDKQDLREEKSTIEQIKKCMEKFYEIQVSKRKIERR